MLKLYRPIMDPQLSDSKCNRKFNLYFDKPKLKVRGPLALPPASSTVTRNDFYEDQWLQKHSTSPESFMAPAGVVVQLTSFNQTPNGCSEWYGRPQTSPDFYSRSNFNQVSIFNDFWGSRA